MTTDYTKNIVLEVSLEELGVISNALNEILHALDIHDFSTRIGVEIPEAKRLLDKTNNILKNNLS